MEHSGKQKRHGSGDSIAAKVVDRKSLFEVTVLNRSRTAFQKQAFETDGLQGSTILRKDEESRRWSEAVVEGRKQHQFDQGFQGKDTEQHLRRNIFSI